MLSTIKNIRIACVLFLLILTGCAGGKQAAPEQVTLPHIRYFESTPAENDNESFELYDYDITTASRSSLWRLEDSNIDRIELTPDGRFVLVHYAILETLTQYYVIYDLDSDSPSTPITFTRNDEESTTVSAYQSFLDDGVYKLGFIIGDPDFKALSMNRQADVYQFAWVDLGRKIVEDIPLVTTMDKIPDIIFVPPGGGHFDFIRRDTPQIVRFDWETKETVEMKKIYNPSRDPILKVEYIGSFSFFADFEKSSRAGKEDKAAIVGIRTPDNVIPLPTGDFPLWSLGDIYIFLRVFPPEVMGSIALGMDSQAILKSMTDKNELAKFAIYDLVESKRKSISLTLEDTYALPQPIFDLESGVLAVIDTPKKAADEKSTDQEDVSIDTRSIIVFDIEKDTKIAMITGIPSSATTSIAFHRP